MESATQAVGGTEMILNDTLDPTLLRTTLCKTWYYQLCVIMLAESKIKRAQKFNELVIRNQISHLSLPSLGDFPLGHK